MNINCMNTFTQLKGKKCYFNQGYSCYPTEANNTTAVFGKYGAPGLCFPTSLLTFPFHCCSSFFELAANCILPANLFSQKSIWFCCHLHCWFKSGTKMPPVQCLYILYRIMVQQTGCAKGAHKSPMLAPYEARPGGNNLG